MMRTKILKAAAAALLCAFVLALLPAHRLFAASADVNLSLTAERTAFANGEYASFSAKYTLDYGNVQPGDTITVTVPSVLQNVSIAYSKLHFSACNDLGGGTYQLVFNDAATTGLTGYFSIQAFAANTSAANATGTLTVGGQTLNITVSPTPGGGEAGQETRAIEKWAPSGTNYTQTSAENGVYTEGAVVTYSFEVDPRCTAMTGVTVEDTLPDELSLVAGSIVIERTNADRTGTVTLSAEQAAVFNKSTGKTLKFAFGDMDGTYYYRVSYAAAVAAGTNVNIANTARIVYDGGTVETSSFTIKPQNGAGAAVGYKKVDKTQITDDPADQIVTYTIKFANDNVFAKGDIRLSDHLDSRVRLVAAYGSDYFNVAYDKTAHAVAIENSRDIPASMEQVVTIVVDFTDVPVGATVSNTVGGNTVKTAKVHEGALIVRKTVTGTGADLTKAFHFTVALKDNPVSGTYGEMTFVNGIAEFTLKNGESKRAVKLPAGAAYTVAEDDYSADGYTATKTGDTGILAADTDSTAVFTNTYAKKTTPGQSGTGSTTPGKGTGKSTGTVIPTNPVPKSSGKTPHTGDTENPLVWACAAALSAAGILWLSLSRRRRRARR